MAERLADAVVHKIGHAAELYYHLIVLVAPAGAGKTAALQEVHERTGAPLVNVNLELARRMLDLTERQRALQLPLLLAEIVEAAATDLSAPQNDPTRQADVILLDNVELLFGVSLKQDPLRLLQKLSRNKTVVAAWSGEIRSVLCAQPAAPYLVYATPDHPEYRRYPVQDFLVVSPEATT